MIRTELNHREIIILEQRILARALVFEGQIAMLFDVDALFALTFKIEAHNIIWGAMKNILKFGTPLRPDLLLNELQRLDGLEEAGGAAYIAELLGCAHPDDFDPWRYA